MTLPAVGVRPNLWMTLMNIRTGKMLRQIHLEMRSPCGYRTMASVPTAPGQTVTLPIAAGRVRNRLFGLRPPLLTAPQVAINDNGVGFAVWSQEDVNGITHIWANQYSTGLRLGRSEILFKMSQTSMLFCRRFLWIPRVRQPLYGNRRMTRRIFLHTSGQTATTRSPATGTIITPAPTSAWKVAPGLARRTQSRGFSGSTVDWLAVQVIVYRFPAAITLPRLQTVPLLHPGHRSWPSPAR